MKRARAVIEADAPAVDGGRHPVGAHARQGLCKNKVNGRLAKRQASRPAMQSIILVLRDASVATLSRVGVPPLHARRVQSLRVASPARKTRQNGREAGRRGPFQVGGVGMRACGRKCGVCPWRVLRSAGIPAALGAL